jgi:hypothetical protein
VVNFGASFKIGIEAAETAKKNKQEIRSIFARLNVVLAAETAGTIKLVVKRFPRGKAGLAALMTIDLFEPVPSYSAIAAELYEAKGKSQPLAEWVEGRAGYPCTIKLSKRELFCEDKEGLESGLASLLEDPIVGSILHTMIESAANQSVGTAEHFGDPILATDLSDAATAPVVPTEVEALKDEPT